ALQVSESSEFRVGATPDPPTRVAGKRSTEVRRGLRNPTQADLNRSAFVVPKRLFAECTRARIFRELREPFVQQLFGRLKVLRPQRGCTGFEPEQTIAWVS